MTLNEAIEEVKTVTKMNDKWTADDFSTDGYAGPIDDAIAVILNAVAADQLVPNAEV